METMRLPDIRILVERCEKLIGKRNFILKCLHTKDHNDKVLKIEYKDRYNEGSSYSFNQYNTIGIIDKKDIVDQILEVILRNVDKELSDTMDIFKEKGIPVSLPEIIPYKYVHIPDPPTS